MAAYRSTPETDAKALEAARPFFRITEEGERLTIRYRWPKLRMLPSLLGAASGAFLLWRASNPARSLARNIDRMFFNPPGVIFGALVLGSCYGIALYLLNWTTVVIDRDFVRVTVGPVPWPGRVQIPRNDVAQLYVVKRVRKNTKTSGSTEEFTLKAKTIQGSEIDLVSGPLTPGAAHALERLIEARLRITDEPVRGEDRP